MGRLCMFVDASDATASSLVDDEPLDRIDEGLRLVAADRMAALLEDAQLGTGNEAGDLFGEFRRTDPVMAAGQDEGRRRYARQLGAQIEGPKNIAQGAVQRLDVVERALRAERAGGGVGAA